MEGKNKKTKVFKWAAVMMLAAMMIVGCKQAQGSSSSGEKYAVTFGAGEHGTLKAKADGVTETDKSPISVEKDKTVTFTATANTGYVVDKWTIFGSSFESGSGADGSTTAKVKVTANTTVNVTFKQQAVTPPTPPASTDKTYTVGGISFTMKGIAAVTNGKVGHSDYSSDNAEHTVSLTAYRIGETEVTQELWQAVMGNEPSYFDESSGKEPVSGEAQKKRPVENVNWYHAIAFCNKLSKACNLAPCYTVKDVNFDTLTFGDIPTSNNIDWNSAVCDWSKNGFRLPTETEWEWAAMGGKDYKWSGTNELVQLINYAWYNANSGNKTHEVKQKQANGYGLYDMSGNVWEWCWDWYDTLPNPLPEDYSGAASGRYRVLRGGSWDVIAEYCVVGVRSVSYPDCSNVLLGFRLALRP